LLIVCIAVSTSSLVAAFSGEPALDIDDDGVVTFADASRFIALDMAFFNEQRAMAWTSPSFDANFRLATVKVPAKIETVWLFLGVSLLCTRTAALHCLPVLIIFCSSLSTRAVGNRTMWCSKHARFRTPAPESVLRFSMPKLASGMDCVLWLLRMPRAGAREESESALAIHFEYWSHSFRWKAKILLHTVTDDEKWLYVRWASDDFTNCWQKADDAKIRAFRPMHYPRGTALEVKAEDDESYSPCTVTNSWFGMHLVRRILFSVLWKFSRLFHFIAAATIPTSSRPPHPTFAPCLSLQIVFSDFEISAKGSSEIWDEWVSMDRLRVA
jgi:hypothetical protein